MNTNNLSSAALAEIRAVRDKRIGLLSIMAREFSRQFYHSKEWQQVRQSILMRDHYLCVKCGKPAEEVHHIIHLTPENINDKMISSGADNLISLCGLCHKHIHGYGQSKHSDVLPEIAFDDEGNPITI